MTAPATRLRTNALVYVALLALLAATVALDFVDLGGAWNQAATLARSSARPNGART